MTDFPSLLSIDDSYLNFFNDLKSRIRQAQVKAALAVNQELIKLYWQIGREILIKQEQEGWGAKIIDRLAKDLKREFPDIKGFSRTNLKYMRTFAEAYSEGEIGQQLAGQIPWFHNCVLLEKVKDPTARLWYLHQTIANGWSRNILVMQIETSLYERQGGATTNFQQALPAPQSDLAQQLIKDPYHLDFVSLAQGAQERDLEQALVSRIRDFLLELGVGFAFVGSQYRLEVDGNEYFIDMLFYHLKLRCYIVIDLKVTEFKPEYSGKMNFYVSAVNHLLAEPVDNPTIGIILCRSQKKTIVEFALQTVQNPIGVATYKLREDLPPALQGQLPTAEQLEMEMEAAVAAIGTDTDNVL